jgi:hypothetical protein
MDNELKIKLNKLEDDIILIKQSHDEFKKDKQNLEAIVKLNECAAIADEHFRLEYKKRFKPKRNEYIPNIGDIIKDPPLKDDDEEYYIFWENFKNYWRK